MAAVPLIQHFPQVDGLERVNYIEHPHGGGSLELCFRTAEKADAFFQSFQYPDGDAFCCDHSDLGSFATRITYPVNERGRVDLDSEIRKFSAVFLSSTGLNLHGDRMHPTQDQLITLLKFVSRQP